MVSEVIVRLGYAVKRIKEGHSIRSSIPISLDRKRHPKLATMLFIAHAGATAANAGKIYFTKNPDGDKLSPMDRFCDILIHATQMGDVKKPEMQDAYVRGKIEDELFNVLSSTNEMFEDFTKDYIVVFE